jgi:choline/glycine/proline betaine transport protein
MEHPGPRFDVHPIVFWVSVSLVAAILLPSLVFTERVGAFLGWLQGGIADKLGWLYILSMTGFLGFALFLTFSRFGDVRLGPDDARPEFGRLTWFSMLFSAGMGIGLLFFSVAEPIMHFDAPPWGPGGDEAAARAAMGFTFFHWGLHPWAVYSVVGLSLAYFGFREGLPFSIRSALYPLIGERIHGWAGNVVDVLAILSTLFGVATSLGLGAMQVNAGVHHIAGVEISTAVQIMIIVGITTLATVSVVSGLYVGIRRLSEINMALAGALVLFLFIVGPTFFLLRSFAQNIGAYLLQLPFSSFWIGSRDEPNANGWLAAWTVFYWAWWIAWAPFVGMFIARISKGRTIREFMIAVLLGPTIVGFVWLTVFGNTALYQEMIGGGGIVQAVSDSMSTAVFVLLERYPLAGITGIVGTLCVVLFFVTSSDSASLVVHTIAAGGKESAGRLHRIFWAVLEGIIAAVLLVAGGLTALQTGAITTALPFCIVIIVMCVGLFRGLQNDRGRKRGQTLGV